MSLKVTLFRRFPRLARQSALMFAFHREIKETLDETSWTGADQAPSFFYDLKRFRGWQVLRPHLSGIRFTDREHEREFWAILDGRRGKQRVFCMATPSNAVRVIE